MRRQRAFTLIELVVVLALVTVVLLMTAPSFNDFILIQRLKNINSALVTDMQFARSEAASRHAPVQVVFSLPSGGSPMSCYTLYTDVNNARNQCDCTLAGAARCPSATTTEIKTVQIPTSLSVSFSAPSGAPLDFAYRPTDGGIDPGPPSAGEPLGRFVVETYIDSSRSLRVVVGPTGRPQVCVPPGATISGGYVPC